MEFKNNKYNTFAMSYTLIFLFFLLLFSLTLSYYLYMNLPGESENLNVDIKNSIKEISGNQETNTPARTFENVSQFYPYMKFNHNSISYNIDTACTLNERQRIIEAFVMLSDEVGLINFYETSGKPDIEVSCSEGSKSASEEEFFIAGEGGAKEIIQTGRYNIISDGVVLLYNTPKNSVKCGWPNVELHEVIHVFGFNHSKDDKSLMYPELKDCSQKLDDSIVNKLKKLYSDPNLPELEFENPQAVKNGIYLNFNITIKNSGAVSVDAKDIYLDVYDDGQLVKRFNLLNDLGFSSDDNNLSYGSSISIEINNLKLIHRNPEKIEFIVDKDNKIKEIDESNNVAKITFN